MRLSTGMRDQLASAERTCGGTRETRSAARELARSARHLCGGARETEGRWDLRGHEGGFAGAVGGAFLAASVALAAGCGSGGGGDHLDASTLPHALQAHVIRAVDGDTALVRVDGRAEYVRYIGIDTPETVKPGTPVQCGGPAASAYDHHVVDGRTVRLVFDRERQDAYGRLLAYVYAGRRLVNAELVRRGYARPFPYPPNTAHAALFARLADLAGRRGRGLWGRC
jgi:micrococcal nuclease